MPMYDVSPRLPTAFRLRLGAVERTAKGSRPTHLRGAIRVTSPWQQVVDRIASAYGGSEPEPWQSPDGLQVQTVLPPQPLVVGIMPGQSLSQWWERWNAGGCARRCDGVTETLSGNPCQCPPMPARMRASDACRPTTRLSILLPRLLEGDTHLLAVGRLDSHGIIAAEGLQASLALAQQALDGGMVARATLVVRVRGTGATQYVWPELVLSGVQLPLAGGPELPELAP